ncbi:class I SAM-dependent methyltransferase [Archangium primigenium]|jgi:SAM-dependent methyltransferase|uniref:class I SAM-dependent methyltransferase n=1 Tax=[Archangium] primigenium TaxID=2792470 RepID=UPI00195A4509|nr:class I SAM-dependent methyltransferase [Archangium primigenium]MBM7118673.1 class I SAM-dependent methyltransferase [Archangium primigenium]
MAGNDARGRTPLSLVGQDPDLLFYTRQATAVGGPVLVLGAANGRVAWTLARAGLSVLGVDSSERMVQAAEEMRGAESLEVSGRARLLHADLRSLRLDERFRVVLAPHHALGLMTTIADLEAMLATVRHHLEPDGLFVYDVLNPRAEPPPPGNEEDEPGAAVAPRRPVFTFHLRERKRADAPSGIHRLKFKPFSSEELETAMTASGLTPRERYGTFEGKPFEPSDAHHIGVVDG